MDGRRRRRDAVDRPFADGGEGRFPEWLAEVRASAPERFLLVPGVGAQGGTLEAVCRAGWSDSLAGGLLVNVGRSLMYASDGEDFAEAAREEALRLQRAMALELSASR